MKSYNFTQKGPSLGSIKTSEAEIHLRNENENAPYQAKEGYTKTKTDSIEFNQSDRTGDVNFQSSGSDVMPVSKYRELMLNSSFKDLYERVSREYDEKILKQAPRDAKEWYYATGGIMPYKK